MMTTALPEGESAPDVFVLDMRQVAWDGTAGVTLTAPWEGHGMAATQSHALRFEDFPATRIAWPGQLSRLQEAAGGHNQCLFTAVIVGIVETALEAARPQVARRRDALRAYERVEWTRAEQEGWLIQQAYEGMLRAVEEDRDGRRHVDSRQDGHRGAGRGGNGSALPGAGRGDLLALLTLRVLVRGRAGAWLLAAAVGAGV